VAGYGASRLPDGIARFIGRDNRLVSIFPLISWAVGQSSIVLEGEFSAAQLREMADHMERSVRPVRTAPWPYLAPF
jgi:hypothetical protein